MPGLCPTADCTLACGLIQAGHGHMIFDCTLSAFWNDLKGISYVSWCSAQQALLKHPPVVCRWPRLTCLQVFLWIVVGCRGELCSVALM